MFNPLIKNTADIMYINHIKKLYPNINDDELNVMFCNFQNEMILQINKSKEAELYRYGRFETNN